MAIASVIQRGNFFVVYDESNRQLASIFCQDGQLLGYTASSVSLKRNNYIFVYNENGNQISSRPAW